MRAIAMSLEGGEEVEEKDRKGSREELLSIKGELLMTQNVRGCPFKCSDGAEKEMLASMPSLGDEVDEDEEEMLKRAIAMSLEEEEEEDGEEELFSVKGDLLKKAACQFK